MKYQDLPEPVRGLVDFLVDISSSPEELDTRFGIGKAALELPEYFFYEEASKTDLEIAKKQNLLNLHVLESIEELLIDLENKDEQFWDEFVQGKAGNSFRSRAKDLIQTIGLGDLMVLSKYTQYRDKDGVVEFPEYFVIIEKNASPEEKELAINISKKEFQKSRLTLKKGWHKLFTDSFRNVWRKLNTHNTK